MDSLPPIYGNTSTESLTDYPIGELFTLGVLYTITQTINLSATPHGFKFSNPVFEGYIYIEQPTNMDYCQIFITEYLPDIPDGYECKFIFANAHGTEKDNREFAFTTLNVNGTRGYIRVYSGDNENWSSNTQTLDAQAIYVELKCLIDKV